MTLKPPGGANLPTDAVGTFVFVESYVSGATSVSAGIQAAMDVATSTQTARVVFAPGKTYTLDAILLLRRNLAGLTLDGTGATLKLSSAARRVFDFEKIADGDTFQNITILGFTIDGDGVGGAGHVLLGTYPLNQTYINFDRITVRDVRCRNLGAPSYSTFPNHQIGIFLVVNHTLVNETWSPNTITNITIERFSCEGGNVGVTVAGVGPGAFSNVYFDNIVLRDCVHDSGAPLITTVVDAVNVPEVQSLIATSASSGTFTLTFDGDTTAAINWNDSAATVGTRLNALASITTAGGVTCSGGALPGTAVTITFNVAGRRNLITATSSLVGGVPVITRITAGQGAITATQTTIPVDSVSGLPASIGQPTATGRQNGRLRSGTEFMAYSSVNAATNEIQGVTRGATLAFLAAAVNESQTTGITVTSSQLLPASGTAILDQEQVTYSSISAGVLQGATRGANGTTPTSHAQYAVVGNLANCATHADGLAIGIAAFGANNFHIGSGGFGGRATLEGCTGIGCYDTAFELNNGSSFQLQSCTARDVGQYSYTVKNFRPSRDPQHIWFNDCKVENYVVNPGYAGTSEVGFGWVMRSPAGGGLYPTEMLSVKDCRLYSRQSLGTVDSSAAVGIYVAGSSVRRLVVENYDAHFGGVTNRAPQSNNHPAIVALSPSDQTGAGLAAAINDSQTTGITLRSPTGLAAAGTLTFGTEDVTYTSIVTTGTGIQADPYVYTLAGVARGANATVAAAHGSGTTGVQSTGLPSIVEVDGVRAKLEGAISGSTTADLAIVVLAYTGATGSCLLRVKNLSTDFNIPGFGTAGGSLTLARVGGDNLRGSIESIDVERCIGASAAATYGLRFLGNIPDSPFAALTITDQIRVRGMSLENLPGASRYQFDAPAGTPASGYPDTSNRSRVYRDDPDHARVFHSVVQANPDATSVPLLFNSERLDSNGLHKLTTTTTLSAAVNSSATTIPVVATAAASTGTVYIDSEQITYSGVTGVSPAVTAFTGATRGANGTTAASHTIATPVGVNGIPSSRVTAITDGVYTISAHVSWAANGAPAGVNDRQLFMQHVPRATGVALVVARSQAYPGTGAQNLSASTVIEMEAGDYVEAVVSQTSGAAVNILRNANYSPELSMVRTGDRPLPYTT